MSGVIFSSELRSDNNTRYKVELFGDDYVGLPKVAIIGGTGNTFYINKDWRDYLQTGKNLFLHTSSSTQAVSVTGISSNGITTQITTSVAYSATFTHIGGPSSTTTTDQYKPTFTPDLIDLKTEWKGEGDEILGSIKSSSTSVTYANNDRYFDRFFEQYQITQDNKLKLLVYRYTTDWELDWAGIIVMDLVQWSNIDKPRPYTFKAIDGFDALKKYEYTQTTLSVNKIQSNIFEILDILGLKQFWSSSDAYIRESIEYKSRVLAATTSTDDSPLDYTYIPDNLFIGDTNKNPTQYISYYDALKGLMDLFSCRIYHADGVYWIQQVRNFGDSVIEYRQYLKDGTYTHSSYTHQKSVGNSGGKDLRILAGGTFGYFAGAYRTRIEAKQHIEGKLGIEGITLSSRKASIETRSINIGTIKSEGVGHIRVAMRVRTATGQYANHTSNFSCIIDIELKSGNRYIKGIGPAPQLEAEWYEDSVSTNRKWTKIVKNSSNSTYVYFDAPTIDFEANDMIFQITTTYDGKDEFRTMANGTSGFSNAFYIDRIEVLFPQELSDDENTMTLEVENPSGFYTKEVELDPLIIVDSEIGTTTIAKIQIDENYDNAQSFSLVESTQWDCDFDTYPPLSYARVMEAMSLQTKPVEKIMSTIVGDYYPFQSLAYNDKVYVFSGCTRDYEMDEVSGEWFEVIAARTDIAMDRIKDIIDPNDISSDNGEVKKNLKDIYEGIKQLTPMQDSSVTYTEFQVNRIVADGGVFEGEDYIETFFPDSHVVQQINIPAYNGDRIYQGDILSVINGNNNNETDFFEVTADVLPNATFIPVVQKETTYPISEGDIPVFKKGEVTESNKVRADLFQMKGNAAAPTPEGGGDYFKNGEFMFYGSYIYWRDGNGDYHRLQGNTHHPE
jgi:hypothetical protein